MEWIVEPEDETQRLEGAPGCCCMCSVTCSNGGGCTYYTPFCPSFG